MWSAFKKTVQALLSQRGILVESAPPGLNREERLTVDFDFVVRDFLGAVESPSDVTFMQVGAFDGVSGDPIHEYVTRYDWAGLLIEPQPYYFQRLQDTYADQEGISLFQGAVARNEGHKTLYVVDNPEADDLPDWAGQIASFDRDTLLSHAAERGGSIPDLEARIHQETVRVMHPMNLLKQSDLLGVDIIQIDVEGFDAEVVLMLDLNAIQPRIIHFEHKHLTPGDYNAAVEFLTSHGYRIAQSWPDTVAYMRP